MMELAYPKICRVSTRLRPRTSHGVGPVCRWERMMSQLAGRQAGRRSSPSIEGRLVFLSHSGLQWIGSLTHVTGRTLCLTWSIDSNVTLIDKPRIMFDQMSGYTSPSRVDRLNPMSQGCREVVQGHVAARIFLHHCIHAAQPERSL